METRRLPCVKSSCPLSDAEGGRRPSGSKKRMAHAISPGDTNGLLGVFPFFPLERDVGQPSEARPAGIGGTL